MIIDNPADGGICKYQADVCKKINNRVDWYSHCHNTYLFNCLALCECHIATESVKQLIGRFLRGCLPVVALGVS